jgi:hypothetical protein
VAKKPTITTGGDFEVKVQAHANKKKTANGVFTPKNPDKYHGKHPISYRSSWELRVMMKLDDHPYYLAWSSESVNVTYYHPYYRKWKTYLPDFLVKYMDRNGKHHIEMIEVKPVKESPLHDSKKLPNGKYQKLRLNEQTKAIRNVNAAKWQAAKAFCDAKGWKFVVWTEEEIFQWDGRK